MEIESYNIALRAFRYVLNTAAFGIDLDDDSALFVASEHSDDYEQVFAIVPVNVGLRATLSISGYYDIAGKVIDEVHRDESNGWPPAYICRFEQPRIARVLAFG